MNDQKKRMVETTSRRGFVRLLLGGAAGAAMTPVLLACQKSDSYQTEKTIASTQAAALSVEGFAKAAPLASSVYPFKLPDLPYDYNALNPAIFERTMQVHHGKHHNGYTNKLNAALEAYPQLQERSIVDLLSNINDLPQEVQTAVRNNGGGYFNHSLFWPMMKPQGGDPQGELAAAINRDFGSFISFKEQFSMAAKTLFGSGWAWLVVNSKGKLEVMQTVNQDTPLMAGKKPVLGIDVWEHAYYLQYENRRAEYVDNFWSVVNWDQCAANFGA